jgi:uncharacterized lipoprotein YajG
MRLSIALTLLAATLLAGCSREPQVIKETVIERPVVKETTVVQPAAGATSPPNCTYASQAYSHGSVSCQDRTQYRCDNGVWSRTLTAC